MEGEVVRVNSVLLPLSLSETFSTLSLFSFIFKGLELEMMSCQRNDTVVEVMTNLSFLVMSLLVDTDWFF